MDKGQPMAREYLEEAKTHFKFVSDSNDIIKKRAVHMMSFIGVTMAAAVGFRTSNMTDLDWGIYVESGAMVLMVVAMIQYFRIMKTGNIEIPINAESLLKEDGSKHRLKDQCYDQINSKPEDYYPEMLTDYLECALKAMSTNSELASRFNNSTMLFVVGVSTYVMWVLAGNELVSRMLA